MQTMTPGQERMARANEKRWRAADEKHAERMRARGWIVIPPEEAATAPRNTQ